jgi:hypothetical protein
LDVQCRPMLQIQIKMMCYPKVLRTTFHTTNMSLCVHRLVQGLGIKPN